jgi:hypothetical protein
VLVGRFLRIASGEGSFGQFDELSVRDVSGGGDDEIARVISVAVKVGSARVVEGRDGFGRAFDGATERVVGVIGSVKKFA